MIPEPILIALENASRQGDLTTLEKLANEGHLMGSTGPTLAAMGGHLKVIEWYRDHGIEPNFAASRLAAQHGQLNVLIWLDEKGLLKDDGQIWDAAVGGHIEIMKWLHQKGYRIKSYPVEFSRPVFDLLYSWGVPITHQKFNSACSLGDLEFLKWAKEKGHLPDGEAGENAKAAGQQAVLDWFKENQIELIDLDELYLEGLISGTALGHLNEVKEAGFDPKEYFSALKKKFEEKVPLATLVEDHYQNLMQADFDPKDYLKYLESRI